jgi:L,D-transpeptidase ErfK/SrfK
MKQLPVSSASITAARLIFAWHILVALVFWPVSARGATFFLPTDGSNIVGQLQVVAADSRNTLLDIGRHFDLGFEEITAANPGVSIWLPGEGTRIIVPTQFILPPRPWQGIVINIPQRRLYYFPRHKPRERATVVTFPIGTARPGWPTPLGTTRITGKHKDPAWFVPKSIQEEHRNQGEPDFPEYFPPGPDNPMGMLALETGFAKIFIHGTNRPWGVGMRVTHGCIRLYPEDAAYLFPAVPVGTPVRIINQPVMAGERDTLLYLSVSEPVDDYPGDQVSLLAQAMDALTTYDAPVDWSLVEQAVAAGRMLPIPVSVGAPSLDEITASIKPEIHDFEPYGVEANQGLPPPPRGTDPNALPAAPAGP